MALIRSREVPTGMSRIEELDLAWSTGGAGARQRAVRAAAERLRDRFANGPRVVSARTLPLSTLLYPARYAFDGMARSPAPLVVLTHRCVVVQLLQGGALKTLLFNPTDVDRARAAPYLARLSARLGARAARLLVEQFDPVETQLARLGIAPGDVDYLAFGHFRTQDLRPLLGTGDGAAPRFPNATLLASARAWNDWDDPHPAQRAWFVGDGKRGVPPERVALLDGDVALGSGAVLLRTPGLTAGHSTLFLSTDRGVWGVSANGTAADSWSPLDSRIAGLAAACRASGVDVVGDGSTPESAADQYTSMILERTLADRVRRAPAFAQVLPSSEVTPSKIAPGLAPTLLHRAITSGDVARPERRAA
jgi:hypothetical protein